MKQKIILSALLIVSFLVLSTQSALAFEPGQLGSLFDFSGLSIQEYDSGGFWAWIREIFEGHDTYDYNCPPGHTPPGGAVGAPIDGGLLALLAGAGITYFGARRKKKNQE